MIFGKTNLPEFALKGVSNSQLFGRANNPWNVDHTPGGSSGGAAAAVASGVVPMAAGNDGGGSIRIPAACCGLFGLRPSRARHFAQAPAYGEYWYGASSEGVISRSVRDTAAALDVSAGNEPGDPFVSRRAEPALRGNDAARSRPAAHRLYVGLADRNRGSPRSRRGGERGGKIARKPWPRGRGSRARDRWRFAREEPSCMSISDRCRPWWRRHARPACALGFRTAHAGAGDAGRRAVGRDADGAIAEVERIRAGACALPPALRHAADADARASADPPWPGRSDGGGADGADLLDRIGLLGLLASPRRCSTARSTRSRATACNMCRSRSSPI